MQSNMTVVKAFIEISRMNGVSEHIYSNALFIRVLNVYDFFPSIQSGK